MALSLCSSCGGQLAVRQQQQQMPTPAAPRLAAWAVQQHSSRTRRQPLPRPGRWLAVLPHPAQAVLQRQRLDRGGLPVTAAGNGMGVAAAAVAAQQAWGPNTSPILWALASCCDQQSAARNQDNLARRSQNADGDTIEYF
jgi:hypothetical protein